MYFQKSLTHKETTKQNLYKNKSSPFSVTPYLLCNELVNIKKSTSLENYKNIARLSALHSLGKHPFGNRTTIGNSSWNSSPGCATDACLLQGSIHTRSVPCATSRNCLRLATSKIPFLFLQMSLLSSVDILRVTLYLKKAKKGLKEGQQFQYQLFKSPKLCSPKDMTSLWFVLSLSWLLKKFLGFLYIFS